MLARGNWLGALVLAFIFWIIGIVAGALPVPAVVATVCYAIGGLFFLLFVIFLLLSFFGGVKGGRGPGI